MICTWREFKERIEAVGVGDDSIVLIQDHFTGLEDAIEALPAFEAEWDYVLRVSPDEGEEEE